MYLHKPEYDHEKLGLHSSKSGQLANSPQQDDFIVAYPGDIIWTAEPLGTKPCMLSALS